MPLYYPYILGNRKWLNLSRLSDSQLVWLYNETGERSYFSELFMRYLPLIYGTALKYVPDEEQAKAAVKRFYDSLFETFDKTDFYASLFRDWLYVRLTEFLEEYAKENRMDERRYFSSGIRNTLSEEAFLCASILEEGGQEASGMLSKAKDALTKAEYTCIDMFFIRRRSFRSISASTGYLAGAVKRHIESGLEKMAGLGLAETYLETESVR
ncbi:MAG: hypothetical protein LUF87_02560 [Alistipes sp.]|nr:hypothetical protein [Alistipes sp.]